MIEYKYTLEVLEDGKSTRHYYYNNYKYLMLNYDFYKRFNVKVNIITNN